MKKFLSGITTMMLVIGLFTTGVQAKELNTQEIKQMIEQTNKEIYELINEADDKGDALVLSYEANKISERQLNHKLDQIIGQLIDFTSNKTEKLIKEAAKNGVKLEAQWIEVEIGGRNVLVDPLITDGF